MAAELEGKVAIVTGGARGQGASHARRFVAEGARVLLSDVLDDLGEALADELGASAIYRHHDVTEAAGWTAIVAEVEALWGRLDILVNNAGVRLAGPIHAVAPEAFRRLIEINLTGTYLGIWAAADALARTGAGAIVNVSSIAGLRALHESAAYAASKFAVRGLTKGAALDLAPLGIRVNAVLPGIIDTPMVREHTSVEDILDRRGGRLLIKRLGTPEEVTEAVLFLASDRSSYITGADLLVDAGWSAQ
jgi:3alpha(or 20beta)-hydroxysteroid dehydrogenase